MFTNPSNIVKTLVALLDRNAEQINRVVRSYQSNRKLLVLEGMRKVLPVDAYPSLEIEAQTSSNTWATTRAQRPRYDFECTLTARNDNERFSHEYITTLATALTEIMTSPENLQMRVVGETKWDPMAGLVESFILDSLVDSVTYSAAKSGSMRIAKFNWFAVIHEPFPDVKWRIDTGNTPTIIRPRLITL